MKEIPQDFYIFVENASGFKEALADGEDNIMVGDERMVMKKVDGNRITVRRYVTKAARSDNESISLDN